MWKSSNFLTLLFSNILITFRSLLVLAKYYKATPILLLCFQEFCVFNFINNEKEHLFSILNIFKDLFLIFFVGVFACMYVCAKCV